MSGTSLVPTVSVPPSTWPDVRALGEHNSLTPKALGPAGPLYPKGSSLALPRRITLTLQWLSSPSAGRTRAPSSPFPKTESCTGPLQSPTGHLQSLTGKACLSAMRRPALRAPRFQACRRRSHSRRHISPTSLSNRGWPRWMSLSTISSVSPKAPSASSATCGATSYTPSTSYWTSPAMERSFATKQPRSRSSSRETARGKLASSSSGGSSTPSWALSSSQNTARNASTPSSSPCAGSVASA